MQNYPSEKNEDQGCGRQRPCLKCLRKQVHHDILSTGALPSHSPRECCATFCKRSLLQTTSVSTFAYSGKCDIWTPSFDMQPHSKSLNLDMPCNNGGWLTAHQYTLHGKCHVPCTCYLSNHTGVPGTIGASYGVSLLPHKSSASSQRCVNTSGAWTPQIHQATTAVALQRVYPQVLAGAKP